MINPPSIRWLGRVALLGITAAAASCGGSDLTLPSEEIKALQVVAGQDQTGTVGTALAESLIVRIVDQTGAAVAGVEVAWSASGGGSVTPSASTTDADGRVSAERVLGTEPGSYTTTVTAPVAEGSPTVFLATASPGAPNGDHSAVAVATSIVASSGDDAATVTVTVRDQHGNPVPNIQVTLAATGSGNNLTQPSGQTNSQGVATGSFSSTAAGVHVISAKADGAKIDETVSVTVTPAAADRSRSKAEVPNGTAGELTAVTVRLRDQFNNTITGARTKLGISASGANSGASFRIGEMDNGEYSATYTPTKAGTDFIRVTLTDATPFSDPFTSTVVPGRASAARTVASVEGTATIFEPSVDIAIDARDAYGNAIRRAGEGIAVTAAKGNDRLVVPVTYDGNSGLYIGTFQPWSFGTFAVEVLVNGLGVPGSPFTTVMKAF